MKMVCLKIKDGAESYDDYFDPSDIKRLKERTSVVSMLVAGETGREWIELDMLIQDAWYAICVACNGVMTDGGGNE